MGSNMEAMKETEAILKCIEIVQGKYNYYYNEAKRVGQFDAEKERECVRAAMALKEAKDEMFEMMQRLIKQ